MIGMSNNFQSLLLVVFVRYGYMLYWWSGSLARGGMAFIIGLVLLLGGCGPRLIGVTKSPGYNESITGAVVVLVAGRVDAIGPDTTVASRVEGRILVSSMRRSLETFNSVLKRRMPSLAADSGFSLRVIETADADFDSKDPVAMHQIKQHPPFRQFVKVQPVNAFTTCPATCKTVLKVAVNVYDRRLERDVWSATLDVSEKSGIHPFDDGDIGGFWNMVTEQMRASGLIS